MKYDIIGDVHGHAAPLMALLGKLGYSLRRGTWQHPARTAIFVGDLIDRGPEQLDTLNIVRRMVDGGFARAVMGNHEFNAIAWATPDPRNAGRHLRERDGEKGAKNRRQHAAFLMEVSEDTKRHKEWIQWFLGLPLWIEEPGFRVVHACWSSEHVEKLAPCLREGAKLKPEALPLCVEKGTDPYNAVEVLLKGLEVDLPHGVSFLDKDKHPRHAMRTKWWDSTLSTYHDAYIGPEGAKIPKVPLPPEARLPEPDRPTFIGHYWLEPDAPLGPRSGRVACVDYSVANHGPLVAYRFDGEGELTKDKFVAVGR